MFFRVLVLLLAAISVAGQGSTVVCSPNWGWANNTLGQNPCVVASYLITVCLGNTTLDPLGPDSGYDPPPPGQRTPCDCSTVSYSLISACELCQGSPNETWSDWSTSCNQIYDRQFNRTVPPETAIPSWAYQDVIAEGTFDASVAQAYASAPPSTSTTAGSRPSTTPSSTGGSVPLDTPRIIWACSVVFVYASSVLFGFL